jgi:predicted P-loop ATPase/GTPase
VAVDGTLSLPTTSLAPTTDPDAVAVVDPGRVRVYDGERYGKGCAVASGAPDAQSGRLEERVGDVTDMIDPVETRPLPPLPKEEQTDSAAVADAYGEAYDAVLDAAGT